MKKKEELMQCQIIFEATEKSILRFETYLRTKGIFLGMAPTEEDMQILKATYGYQYKAYCKDNNYEMDFTISARTF